MANLDNALQQLREERGQAELQIKKLDSAISVLEGLVGRNSSRVIRNSRPNRVVSVAARKRMARAQRARWAKVRRQSQSAQAGKPVGASPAKRTLSVTARRKIAAAQRARWARVRAQQTKKAA